MVIESIGESLLTAIGLLWKALWALALGYTFSAIIQTFFSKKFTGKHLGKSSILNLSKAAVIGFISSSCSFAALSTTKNLFTKGASLTSALAYMFASTNLAIEVAVLAYIFLGWEYALGLFIGAPIIITIQSILVKITYPKKLAEQAREKAKSVSGHDHNHGENSSKKITSLQTWKSVASSYKAEWKMVYKEILIGFLVAGFVATLVPDAFFQAIFPTNFPEWITLPLQAILAPVLALITVIGSMGNGPLAAILANNGVLFGAIMAFLYADFNVPPAVKINAKYYGWKFALYLAAITAVSAILTGIVVHGLYALIGILPTSAKSVTELATFAIDYTFWLNIVSVIIAGTFFYIAQKNKKRNSN